MKDEGIKYVNEESDSAEMQIKKLKKFLKKCRAKNQDNLAGWQRAQADLQNYRRQKDEEMDEFRKFMNTNLLLKFLPILDNLELACKLISDEDKNSAWGKGIVNVKRQFMALLAEEDVIEINPQEGEKFDPQHHEAIEEVGGEGESGSVSEVMQKGYMLHGKVIRAARVKVNK